MYECLDVRYLSVSTLFGLCLWFFLIVFLFVLVLVRGPAFLMFFLFCINHFFYFIIFFNKLRVYQKINKYKNTPIIMIYRLSKDLLTRPNITSYNKNSLCACS